MNAVPTGISWRDWSTETFTAAHRAGLPVLLVIGAHWSSVCRRFDRDVLADPAVADLIARRFVPLAVDLDRRPDIAARYVLSEPNDAGVMTLPTVLCLTADGEVLSGGGPVDAPRLVHALTALADTFAADREAIERRARETRRARREAQEVSPAAVNVDDAVAHAAERLTEAFDDTWAGFGPGAGGGAKQPHTSAVAFALAVGVRTGDARLRDMAVRTLDRLGWSELSEARSGAFHRLCHARDWTEPDTARLLAVQAELAGLFLDAATMLGEGAYGDRARAAIDYAVAVLGDPAGGFAESEADRVLITSSNARMVRTLLRAAVVLETLRYGDLALQTIERLVPAVYAQAAGVAHYLELAGEETVPRVRGLFVDQVEVSAALLDLAEASGNRVYLELAEELMRGCLRKFWRADGGGFLDRLRSPSGGGDIGRMGDPIVAIAANALAARVLARLAVDTGHADLRDHAAQTLTAIGPAALADGLLAADYALAALDVHAGLHQGSKQS